MTIGAAGLVISAKCNPGRAGPTGTGTSQSPPTADRTEDGRKSVPTGGGRRSQKVTELRCTLALEHASVWITRARMVGSASLCSQHGRQCGPAGCGADSMAVRCGGDTGVLNLVRR